MNICYLETSALTIVNRGKPLFMPGFFLLKNFQKFFVFEEKECLFVAIRNL